MNKDPTSFDLLTYSWVIGISVWSGIISYYHRMRSGLIALGGILDMLIDISASVLVGILTFFMCELAEIKHLQAAILISASSHAGPRALFIYQKYSEYKINSLIKNVFGVTIDDLQEDPAKVSSKIVTISNTILQKVTNMTAVKKNLPPIEKGATYEHVLWWKDKLGNAIDLTGATAKLQVRTDISDASYVLEMSTENNRIVLGTTDGKITLSVTDEDTTLLDGEGGVYDLEIYHANGKTTRLIEGKLVFKPEVTR